MHTEERIGEAWRLTRDGQLDAALTLFDEVLTRSPGNVDAHYGRGLLLRKQGEDAGAIEELQTAYKLAKSALGAVHVTSVVDGHIGGNDLDTYEDDRYMMLTRMITQRLAELDAEPIEPEISES